MRNKNLLLFFFFLCSYLSAQNLQNPVLPGIADAGVMKYNGKYYIGGVSTNGDFYVSIDLVHWSKPIHVVSIANDWIRGASIGDNQIHANDILYYNGDFHLYWSVNYWGKDKHAVHIVHAESSNVLGPYTEPDKSTWMDNRIDPKVFKDDDGKLYMYMVRFTDGNTIWAREMGNPSKFSGEPRCLFSSLPDTWETMDNRVAEGPWVIKYRDRYYMMYNANHTSILWGNYQLGVAEADSPLGFQNGNKYSYPVVLSNQTLLEENYADLLRYNGATYKPQFSYAEKKPEENWAKMGYDDSSWKRGIAGFASKELKGSTTRYCGTVWNTPVLWLRKVFYISDRAGNLALRVAHDGDTKIYLNGGLIYDKQGSDYCIINLKKEEIPALQIGWNMLAVETTKGKENYFDVSLFDTGKAVADDILMTPGQPNIVRGPNGFEWWLVYMANMNHEQRGQYVDRVYFRNKTLYVDGITGPHTSGYHPEPSKPVYGDTFDNDTYIGQYWKRDDTSAWTVQNGELVKAKGRSSFATLKGLQLASNYLFEAGVKTKGNAGVIVWSKGADYVRVGLDASLNSWYLHTHIGEYDNKKRYSLPKNFHWGVYHTIRIEKNGSFLDIVLDEKPLAFDEKGLEGLFEKLLPGLPGLFADNAETSFDGIIYTLGFDDYDNRFPSWNIKKGLCRNTSSGIQVVSDKFESLKGELSKHYEYDFQVSTLSDSAYAGGYPLYINKDNYVRAMFKGNTRRLEIKAIKDGKQIVTKDICLDTLYTLYPDIKYTDFIEKNYRFASSAWIDALYLSRHEVDDKAEFVDNMFDKFVIEYLCDGKWHVLKSEQVEVAKHPAYNRLSFAPIRVEGIRFINKDPLDLRRHIYKIRVHELFKASYNLRTERKGDNLFLFVEGVNRCSLNLKYPASFIGLCSEKGFPVYNGILFYHTGK